MPETILITGASGFIGRRLARRLAGRGHAVRCLLRRTTAAPAGTSAVPGDLSDPESLKRAVEGVTLIYHSGALVRPAQALVRSAELEENFQRVNVRGTFHLAAAAAAAGTDAFVHLSSIAAMGPGLALREDSPCRPLTLYGRSKLASEKAALEGIGGGRARLVIARPAMIYGAESPSWGRLFSTLRTGFAPLPGGGKNLLSICWIESLLDALTLIAGKGKNNAVYTVSEGSLSVRALTALAAAAMGIRITQFPVPAAALRALSSVLSSFSAASGFSSPKFNYLAEYGACREALADWEHDTSALRALGWVPRKPTAAALQEELSPETPARTAN